MMKVFRIFFLVLLFTACASKDKIPKDILTQPQMQAVLFDMLRADEFVLNYIRNDSLHNKRDESTHLYDEVFTLHKTNKDQFKKSLIFYNGHPDLLKVILDSMENRKNVYIMDMHRKPQLNPDSLRIKRDSLRQKVKPGLVK